MESINQLINQSINQSINHSLNQSINRSINQSINQSVKQSINQSNNQSINQSIYQLLYYRGQYAEISEELKIMTDIAIVTSLIDGMTRFCVWIKWMAKFLTHGHYSAIPFMALLISLIEPNRNHRDKHYHVNVFRPRKISHVSTDHGHIYICYLPAGRSV